MPFIKNNYFLAYEYNKVMKIDYFGNVKWSIYLKTPENNRLHHWGVSWKIKYIYPAEILLIYLMKYPKKLGHIFKIAIRRIHSMILLKYLMES